MAWRLTALALLAGCTAAHPSTAAETELAVWSRLPGATVTIEGETSTLGAREVAMIVRPAIEGTATVLHVEAASASLDLAVDWSPDYDALSLPEGTALDAMTISILRREDDGSCAIGMTNGRAGGRAWSGDYALRVGACGPFGLVRFRRDRSAGPCAPGEDCAGFEEILADGTLRIDPFFGDPGAPEVEATLSDDDLRRVRVALTEPALMELLAGERPCPPVTDTVETMQLEWLLETAENETTACDAPELVRVRALLDELASRYAR